MIQMPAPAPAPDPVLSTVPPSRARRHLIDGLLIVGFLAAATASVVDPGALGFLENGQTPNSVKVVQRAAVYLPVIAALAFGVRLGDRLTREPIIWLIAFLAWATGAAAFGVEPLGDLERMVWFSSFVLLVAFVTVRIGWVGVAKVVSVFGLLFVGAGLGAHASGYVGADVNEFFDAGLFGVDRVRGLSPQANSLGRAGAFTALAGLIVAMSWTATVWKIIGGIAMLSGTTAVVVSQSRVALLSLCIAGALVLARRWKAAHMVSVVAALVALGLVLAILFTGSAVGSRSGDASEFTTLTGRTEVWAEAVQVTLDHPLSGVGIEGFETHLAQQEESGYFSWNPENGHNTFLQASASHGIPGAMLLTLSLCVGLISAWRSRLIGAAAALVMFSVQGLTEATMQGAPSEGVALVTAALVASAAYGNASAHAD